MTEVIIGQPDSLTTRRLPMAHSRFLYAVVAVQGVHVVEHTIQLVQVEVFDVPDDDALGVLGAFFQFQGTEEWLHLVFNLAYLLSLYALAVLLLQHVGSGLLSRRRFAIFLGLGVALETWHIVEHMVIMRNVIHNHGCPCPGIGDAALGVTDTWLHFFYNSLTYIGLLAPFLALRRRQP